MYEDLIAKRVSQIRMQKGVSARDMSLSLGQSESYINKIENKKALPSITGLLLYLRILWHPPKDFFDESYVAPQQAEELLVEIKKLSSEQIGHLLAIIKSMR